MEAFFDPIDFRLAETWPFSYDELLDHLARTQAEEEFGTPLNR